MNKLLIWIIVLVVIPSVSAIPIPQGVSGNVYYQDNLVDAIITIKNLNSSFNVSGTTTQGFYSASIKGITGDTIRVTANHNNISASSQFILSGNHKLNMYINDLPTNNTNVSSLVASISSPTILIFEVDNPLTSNAQIRLINSQESEWISANDYPEQKIPLLVYEDTIIEVRSEGGEMISKQITPKDEYQYEQVIIRPKHFKYTKYLLGPVGWLL